MPCFPNLTGNAEILVTIKATGCKTAILIGTETDVCVAQSALGLISNGFHVVALRDAMATTAGDEENGINRMSQAGAVISSIKALYYEWVRSVENAREIHKNAPDLNAARPKDLCM